MCDREPFGEAQSRNLLCAGLGSARQPRVESPAKSSQIRVLDNRLDTIVRWDDWDEYGKLPPYVEDVKGSIILEVPGASWGFTSVQQLMEACDRLDDSAPHMVAVYDWDQDWLASTVVRMTPRDGEWEELEPDGHGDEKMARQI